MDAQLQNQTSSTTVMSNSAQFTEGPPMNRNLFSLEFSLAGSTILNHVRYAQHARKILADEENYLGLFALDTVIENKKWQYRRCGITPQLNHLLLVFFNIQNAHQSDKENGTNYLPDRPDLDKVLALLHDEGEDTLGFSKEFLRESLHNFIDNINGYIENHNHKYPFAKVPFPSEEKIKQMRSDIDDIIEPFDLVTKIYKNKPQRFSYFEYHARILGKDVTDEREKKWHARATRIKVADKPANGATFVYRSPEMLYGENRITIRADYHQWVNRQIGKMRDIYQNQNFLDSNYTNEENRQSGFINAARVLYPESEKFISLMGKIIDTQLKLYDRDLSNEGQDRKFSSPSLDSNIEEYERICLSPRINMVTIMRTRLKEVIRLDRETQDKEKETGNPITRGEQIGMFGIPFSQEKKETFQLQPIKPAGAISFPSFFTGCPSPC